jgi:cysteine desulfuration protein SufE
MTIKNRELDLIERINFLDEWEDKYEYIIDYASKLSAIKEQYKTDDYLVKGCQSRLWLQAELNNGNIFYSADCDAEIPKGLTSMLIEVLSDSSPNEVTEANLIFLKDTGIIFHLSPNRVKGLSALIDKMKDYANKLK